MPTSESLAKHTPETLIAMLERSTQPAEAGRIGLRLLESLVSAAPSGRLALSELPAHGAKVLQAIARSDVAARSGDLALGLSGAGLPAKRDALARFCGLSEPRADERLVALQGRLVPLWKVVDAVAHDGVPLDAALEALAEVPRQELEDGFRVLLHADAHGLLHRLTPIDEDPDWRQDQADLRAAVRALSALLPSGLVGELLEKTVEDDAVEAWTTVRAALVSLRAGAAAPDVTLARASTEALRPLLRPVVRQLPPERQERIVLFAIPPPMSAHDQLDDEQLEWLRLHPSEAIAERVLAYAKAWRREPKNKPWDELADILERMDGGADALIEAQRDELPEALLRRL